MGDIVQLPRQTIRSGGTADRGDQQSAQILLFTGVRYQRMTETPAADEHGGGAPTQSGANGKRKRKRG